MCRLTRAQLETLRAEWGTQFRHTVELWRRSETGCTTWTKAEPVAERSGGAKQVLHAGQQTGLPEVKGSHALKSRMGARVWTCRACGTVSAGGERGGLASCAGGHCMALMVAACESTAEQCCNNEPVV
jgi:hypothetical protein